jgi:hypothetical protein
MNTRSACFAAAALALAACSDPRPAIVDCKATEEARPVCGFHNPEDFALLPRGTSLVVSQMGQMDGSEPGSLVFFELASDAITPAFAGSASALAPTSGWGDPACPGAPDLKFSPHGLALARRPDGALQLLVVNHGGRESIEFFEVTDSDSGPSLAWRGCALPPAESFLNDVAALPDGGFVTTHMFPRSGGVISMLTGLLGMSTGWVFEWQPGAGFTKVPHSDGPMPNGIEASRDGETLYVDLYLGDEVRKISRRTGETLASAEIASPDNILWSPDGSLLVASHNAPMNEILACGKIESGSCPFHYSIVQLDPETLQPYALYENVGPPMGAGTAALHVGNELIVGSFKGDRIVRVTLPK